MMANTVLIAIAALVIVIIIAAAVFLGGHAAPPAASTTTHPQTTAPPTEQTQSFESGSSPSVGTYLENATGFALYYLTADVPNSGNSTCYGQCATFWPPYIVAGNLSIGSLPTGANASAFGTITRTNGSRQLTYQGRPLYYYAGDTAAGQVNGQGIKAFGGVWYAVTLQAQPASSTTIAPAATTSVAPPMPTTAPASSTMPTTSSTASTSSTTTLVWG